NISCRELHRILQRVCNACRNLLVSRSSHVRHQELVRKRTRLRNLHRIAQAFRDHICHTLFLEHAMTCESVQVHARHLPRRAARNRSPFRSAKLECSQHLERNVGNFTRAILLECFERAYNLRKFARQFIGLLPAIDEVTEQRCVSRILRTRVDHLHDIREGWILAHASLNNESGSRASSHSRTRRFGAVPSDLRPTTPERMICTKLRSIFALSITRGNTCCKSAGFFVDRTAQSSAGMSFMKPRSRQNTAVLAMKSASTSAQSSSTFASCSSAVA